MKQSPVTYALPLLLTTFMLATDPMLAERKVTGSFGVATFPLHGATAEDIIRVADAGMYVSKHSGGNRGQRRLPDGMREDSEQAGHGRQFSWKMLLRQCIHAETDARDLAARPGARPRLTQSRLSQL